MKDMRSEGPAEVPEAKQAGEVRARYAWTEPAVWTERMLTALETGVKGGKWFSLIDKVYADLKGYFDSIPHDRLMARVEDPLDHRMADTGFEMVRYADDFVVLCRSEAEANAALAAVREWCGPAGLTLHPDKTRIVDARERGGFDFLGYHFERDQHWPSKKSYRKIKDVIRAKTRRANGHSLACIIADLNRTLRGWFEYFKHSHRNTFPQLDGYIRGRLRSILRKQNKRRGRSRWTDQQRWPNIFFAERGLFSLAATHQRLVNP